MSPRKIFIAYFDKVLAAVIVAVCLMSIWKDLGGRRIDSVVQKIEGPLAQAEKHWQENRPPKDYPCGKQPYAQQVDGQVIQAIRENPAVVNFRNIFETPIWDVSLIATPVDVRVEKIQPILAPPADVAATARRGVVILAMKGNPNLRNIEAVKYAIERKTGEGNWAPLGSVDVGKTVYTDPDVLGSSEYRDVGLAENALYRYRVSLYAGRRALTQDEEGRGAKLLGMYGGTQVPDGENAMVGGELWVSGPSKEVTAETPSNVKLIYTGKYQSPEGNDEAQIRVKQWAAEKGKWHEKAGSFRAGARIVVEVTDKDPLGNPVTLTIDSGYQFVEFGQRTDKRTVKIVETQIGPDGGPRLVEVEKTIETLVETVKVRNLKTGTEKVLDKGVEEKETGVDEETKAEEPKRTGRQTLGEVKPEVAPAPSPGPTPEKKPASPRPQIQTTKPQPTPAPGTTSTKAPTPQGTLSAQDARKMTPEQIQQYFYEQGEKARQEEMQKAMEATQPK